MKCHFLKYDKQKARKMPVCHRFISNFLALLATSVISLPAKL